MRRRYEQFCPLACALDVVGDRWTALLLRDLGSGPRRFSDLERSLDGIGPNLLSQRLDQLRGAGLVERRVIGESSRPLYARTALGAAADEFLVPLGRWGMPLLAGADIQRADASMAVFALRSLVRWEELDADPLTVQLDLDEGRYLLAIADAGEPGRRRRFDERISVVQLDEEPAEPVDVTVRGSVLALVKVVPGGSFDFDGPERDVQRLQRALGLAPVGSGRSRVGSRADGVVPAVDVDDLTGRGREPVGQQRDARPGDRV